MTVELFPDQRVKQSRAVATGHDKRDDNYLASVKLVSICIWLRFRESVTQARGFAYRIRQRFDGISCPGATNLHTEILPSSENKQ